MLAKMLMAWGLVAATVTIHAAGLVLLLIRVTHWKTRQDTPFWPATRLVIEIAWWLVLLHLAEIAVWACFYWWQKCLPDIESAFYFAGITYTTVGYGDLVLPKEWRLFGPVEGLAGILMCGLSTGFFFATASRMYGGRRQTNQA